MEDIPTYTAQNRRAWNEIAATRHRSFPDAAFFDAGGSILDTRVLAAVLDVRGQQLLHLQCATGEETLSWAVAGAQATGVDISEEQIARAIRKANAAHLAVHFIASDIYTLPRHLQNGTFDYVYTGGGALMWLPNIERWARIVAAALRPGGRLILWELHPLALCLWVEHEQLKLTDSYFRREQPAYEQGWSHFAGGETAQETKVQFAWPLGDIVTALAQAGLCTQTLHEYPSEEAYRFGAKLDEARQLPGMYLLVARKL